MKRLSLLVCLTVLLVAAFPLLAQPANPDLIPLNDATPAIDVVIALPADTTGTVALDLVQARVTLTDANNAVVFSAADARLHGLELNIAPNSGTHTLTIERLAGVTEAYVNVVSLPQMTVNGNVQLVTGNSVSLNQEAGLSLNGNTPGGTVTVDIPAGTTGVINTSFPGAFAKTQLVDRAGVVLAESNGGDVDALTFVLDGGNYDFTVLGNNLTETVVAGVRVVSAEEGGFTVIETPAVIVEAPAVTAEPSIVEAATACTATVVVSSANLRSGPGTGYSIVNYVYRGENYPVGGQNQENNWVVIGTTDGGSAWLALDAVQMQGSCATLTVFDVPTQDAAPAQIIITSPGFTTPYSDDDEHEAYEHESEGEHEDDDGGEDD